MKESGHNVKLVVVTLLASCMSMALANSAMAQDFDRIWHVDVDAEQGGNGLNWPTAFDNLQTALEAAAEGKVGTVTTLLRVTAMSDQPGGKRGRRGRESFVLVC